MSCVLAITATATKSTAASVSSHLTIAVENIIRGTALPDNLTITVSCEEDKEKVSEELLVIPHALSNCPIMLNICKVPSTPFKVPSRCLLAGPCAAVAGSHLQLPVLHHCVLHQATADGTCGPDPSYLRPHAGFRWGGGREGGGRGRGGH